jgi:hypothetical protein
MNGGHVHFPIPGRDLAPAALAFGVTDGAVRERVGTLNVSLLLLAQDEAGPFWTYRRPTVSDAFAHLRARTSELVEVDCGEHDRNRSLMK